MADIVIGLLWAGLFTYVAWCWAGRSRRARAWAGQPLQHPLVLGTLPAMVLLLFSFGLQGVFGDAVLPLSAPLFLLSFVVLLFAFYTPGWWGPRWFHRMSDRDKVNTRDPLNAAAITMLAGRSPGTSAVRAAEAFSGRGKPVGRWPGGYIYDPDTAERTHGMSRCGTVDGTLTLYPQGLTFAASKAEDELQEHETVLVLPREEISAARVVSARAGVDGVARRGFFHRSPFPRLVVETRERSYLFDVSWGKASRLAGQITAVTSRMP